MCARVCAACMWACVVCVWLQLEARFTQGIFLGICTACVLGLGPTTDLPLLTALVHRLYILRYQLFTRILEIEFKSL